MVAFISSIIILLIGVSIVLFVGSRRPIGTPLTWGEAMVAGTFVFALMLLAYGVVPHQWLAFADNTLLWRADKLLVGVSTAGVVWGQKAKTLGGTGRIIVNYQALRDIIASLIYIIGLSSQVVLWSIWQKRGRRKPGDVEQATSRFNRPVLRKA